MLINTSIQRIFCEILLGSEQLQKINQENYMTHREYWYWLCNIPGFGNGKIRVLLERYKTPEQIHQIGSRELAQIPYIRKKDYESWEWAKKNEKKIVGQYHELEEKNIKFVLLEDKEYPQRLKRLSDYPFSLYVKGELPEEKYPSVAIIGSRMCSEYGKEMAFYFGEELAKHQIQIISGMATGIDCWGQKGALKNGKTFAVLGTGVDICYPSENIALYMQIQEKGGLISEFRIGTKGLAPMFPVRNRLISGLSDLVLVVEAKKKSGSFITVDHALEQGKDVCAIPGRIIDPLSIGCNELIKNGAGIITDPNDILEWLHWNNSSEIQHNNMEEIRPKLTAQEEYVMQFLTVDLVHLEVILEKTKAPIGFLVSQLLQLEIKNYIEQPIKNYVIY